MKKIKRVVLSILVLCFIVIGLLTSDKTYAASDRDFVIENGVLTKYQGIGGDVVIPDGVTSIGYGAFSGCRRLRSITIPNSVTSIDDNVFLDCRNLTSITIPNSVTSIGYGAFSGCRRLRSITIPDSATSIDDMAFSGCSRLTSITIPNSITSIGYGVFSDCSRLTSITIPNSVTSIADNAFSNCHRLRSITIPDSVTFIGYAAFSGCSSLTNITLSNTITSIDDLTFSNCSSLTNITIPDSVTSIGDAAFSYCSSLRGITIPDSVISIGDNAFSNCSKLKEFTIPKNVTKLGSSILENCDSIEKITILNKKVNLIETLPPYALSTLIGDTVFVEVGLDITKPTKTLTIYGYKYSTADEFVTRMNTLQVTDKGFGIKSLKFVPLDKDNTMLDKIKVPKSITITKGKSKKLSIQLPTSLKRVNKFTKKQGQVKLSITYSKELLDIYGCFTYFTKKVSNDTIKGAKKGTGYAYTTVTLPNGDQKVFATKVIVK